MRRFLASGKFTLIVLLVLAGGTALAYVLPEPSGAGVYNSQLLKAGKIAGYAAGPVMAIVSLIAIGILNLLRRIVGLRKVALLNPVVVFAGVVPWLVISWQLTAEPRFTPFAIIAIDFAARPMLWGSLAASVFSVLAFIVLLLPHKK